MEPTPDMVLQLFAERLSLPLPDRLVYAVFSHKSYRCICPDWRFGDSSHLQAHGIRYLANLEWKLPLFGFSEDDIQLAIRRRLLCTREEIGRSAVRLGLGFLLLAPTIVRNGVVKDKVFLARLYRALVGAIWINGGITPTQRFVFETHLEPALGRHRWSHGMLAQLKRAALSDQGVLPEYQVYPASSDASLPWFAAGVSLNHQIIGEGKGPTEKLAREAAACNALRELGWLRQVEPTLSHRAQLQRYRHIYERLSEPDVRRLVKLTEVARKGYIKNPDQLNGSLLSTYELRRKALGLPAWPRKRIRR